VNIRARRIVTLASVMVTCVVASMGMTGVAAAAPAASVCVGYGGPCYATVQAAIDAAHDGDSIYLPAGVFTGGLKINKSVRIIGSGAPSTTIRGGGPVVTIGLFGAVQQPTVVIQGVTIAGGVTHSSSLSTELTGKAGVVALGGGVEIPPAAQFANGATVTIRDSVVSDNRAEPSTTVPSRLPCGVACPFALAGGGGIDNWGVLTMVNTAVRGNAAGGTLASDADGGGVFSAQGTLTLVDSSVTANNASGQRPFGRFAEAGGIWASSSTFFVDSRRLDGRLSITSSRVTGNVAELSTGFSSETEAHAQGGGLVIAGDDDCSQPDSGCVHAAIVSSIVADNQVTTQNATGDAVAFSGGINNDGVLTMDGSVVTANRVSARAPVGSSSGAFADSGGLGMGGYATIGRTAITGNSVTATATGGDAVATFGGMSAGNPSLTTQVSDAVVSGNRLTASTDRGTATVQGAGIGHLDGPVLISRTLISGNSGVARAYADVAQGGGIANLAGPAAPLTLQHSTVTLNQVTTTGGTPAEGGGLYTTVPVALADTVIAHNSPDQCAGSCS
jgi:hypothetical protein